MGEPLTDAERLALEWLRARAHDRFLTADRWVRDGLIKRGLVLPASTLTGGRYTITDRGLEALGAPRRIRFDLGEPSQPAGGRRTAVTPAVGARPLWDDPQVEGDGDWRRDAWVVRALRATLARGAAERGWVGPKNRDGLMAALLTARDKLRRRLLVAEGVDPETGRPIA
jgi:hypothetical protein